jgi:SAM-dependent methyltransferase
MELAEIVDIQNHRAFSGALALKAYTDMDGLMPGEAAILNRLQSRITDRALLDIGVGAGRTTPSMLKLSKDCTAIDYSQPLVDRTRERFNLSSVYCCDVRDMRLFPDSRFDFVLFSFNGIDCIPHEGRLRALREIHRVLKPGRDISLLQPQSGLSGRPQSGGGQVHAHRTAQAKSMAGGGPTAGGPPDFHPARTGVSGAAHGTKELRRLAI